MDCVVNPVDHSNLGWQTTNIKKTCVVTALFISTVVLGALAYYSPISYSLAAIAITVITPAIIAKLFSQAKTPEDAAQLTKKVVLILAITGIFYAGAAHILTYYFVKSLLASIISYNVQSFVLASFCLSGTLGYLGPFAYNALKRVVDFTTSVNTNFLDDYFLERTNNPNIAPKGILENFFFFLALVQPDEMKNLSNLLPNSSREAILIFNLDKIDLQGQFKEVVEMLKSIHLYGNIGDRTYAKEVLWQHMCRILRKETGDLQYSQYKQILSSFPEWKNSFLTHKERDQFINTFKDLESKILNEVEISLKNIETNQNKFALLAERIQFLKDNAQNLKTNTKLQEELERINFDFIDLQKMVVQQASTCKCYASVWVVSTGNQDKIQRIHQLTKKFLELQELTRLNSIVKSSQDELDEDDAVWNFLITVCSLSSETLLDWLEITDYSQIDSKMEELGLNTVKDLFDKGIISKNDLSDMTKVKEIIGEAIRIRLRPPVEPNQDLRSQFYRVLSTAQLSNPLFGKIGRVSAYAFYRLTMTFCVLAPVFVFPKVAAVGFVAGLVCFGPMSFLTQLIILLFDVFRNAMNIYPGQNFPSSERHGEVILKPERSKGFKITSPCLF
jgi:hypothetical protein